MWRLPQSNSLQSPPTLRTIFKVLLCGKSTIITAFITSPAILHFSQMPWQDFNLFSFCNPFSNFRIQLIHCITAGALYIISLIPFQTGYEKQGQHHVSHKHLISAISPAMITYNHLVVVQIFPPGIDSHHKKHVIFSSQSLRGITAIFPHNYILTLFESSSTYFLLAATD